MKKNNRNKSKKNLLGRVAALVLISTSIVFMAMISYMNILPINLLIIVILLILVISILISIVLLLKKLKIGFKVIGIILSLIISICYIMGITYISKTYNFIGKIGSRNEITENYYIMVNSETDYTDISDLNKKVIATFNENIDIYKDAIKKLNKLGTFDMKEYDSINQMVDDLIGEEIDAILISSTHKSSLEEEYEGFKSLTKKLYTIKAKVKDSSSKKHSEIDISSKAFTIYISGNDSAGKISARGRSDVNMLVTINPKTNEVLLVSIPRDYYVQLHNTTGYKDKLTHAGIYGIDMSIQTLEDLFDINIDYYVKVNFSTVLNLVDAIGGVDVYSDQSLTTSSGTTVKQGINQMNGKEALAFARERYSYKTGDRHRVQNQQEVIKAIINKLTSSPSILLKYTKILDSLSSSFETDLEMKNITKLVKLQLSENPSWNIKSYNVNGTDAHDYTYSYGSQELYVMVPIQETVDNAHNYITGMIEGKTLEELGLNE